MFEEEILRQAEEVYNMFSYSYKEGDISSLELIDARRTLIESQTSYVDALFNYRLAIAALEKSIGQPLEGVLVRLTGEKEPTGLKKVFLAFNSTRYFHFGFFQGSSPRTGKNHS